MSEKSPLEKEISRIDAIYSMAIGQARDRLAALERERADRIEAARRRHARYDDMRRHLLPLRDR